MSKIGLQIGVDTGENIYRLVQPSHSQEGTSLVKKKKTGPKTNKTYGTSSKSSGLPAFGEKRRGPKKGSKKRSVTIGRDVDSVASPAIQSSDASARMSVSQKRNLKVEQKTTQ